jgi:Protein of unknown function (DUF2516)
MYGPGMCGSGPRTYPESVDLLFALDDYILLALWLVAIPVGGYAFVHALMQRADAFQAADKLTKPAWLGITGASLLVLIVFKGPQASGALFWLAALVAVLVYIVDVKPAVVGVQGGGQRW